MSRPRRENYSRKSYDPRRAFGSANYLNTVTGGGRTIPAHIKHLWRTAGGILRTLRGPSHATSYTGSFTMEDGSSKSVPVDSTKGLWVGPGYTNLFTGAPTGAEVKALTAQKYCLQCVGGSVDAGAYGTATPSAPLIFTASAGNQTFTPTGCSSWMLSAVGGYVFPYIPPGITNPSAVGTSGGNGASWPLTGSDSAERLVECFRGVPDGVELVTNGDFSDGANGWTSLNITPTVTSGELVLTRTTGFVNVERAFSVVSGSRYLLRGDVYRSSGTGVPVLRVRTGTQLDGTIVGENIITGITAAKTKYYVEFTASSTGSVYVQCCINTAAAVCVFDNISIQKLNPATFTIGALCYMGAGSAELPNGTSVNIEATDNSVNTLQALKDSGGNSYISYSYEGTTGVNNLLGTWSRAEYHMKLVQSKADGSQYRVGNKRLGIDSAIQWGSWVNFDGSFNPTTALRLALNGTIPLHIKGGFTSNLSLSDAEIERQYNLIAV